MRINKQRPDIQFEWREIQLPIKINIDYQSGRKHKWRWSKIRYDGNCDGCVGGGPIRQQEKINQHIRNGADCAVYYKLYYLT